MITRLFFAAFVGGSLIGYSAPALALDWLHDQRKEAGRICMTDHFHDGESGVRASKRAAMSEAVRNWVEYTAGEYGGAWGDFRIARSKSQKCLTRGGGWVCGVKARPCRRG